MAQDAQSIADQVELLLEELAVTGGVRAGNIIVMGVSTSEVQGHRIGTSGTEKVAEQIYEGVRKAQARLGFHAVWQCCEHLNRALVVEREIAEAQGWTEVSAVPVPKAGGSMAAYAYRQLNEPCLVEAVQVHAGIDIGETMIGMHLRPVAVPLRPTIRSIGQARVNMAMTRPRLIGGARAVYTATEDSGTAGVKAPPTSCD
ncbi:TIGR01440 family protein [Cohnella mopanensis]|uniref:TIGR01440 family protein n=1 Tax=Cohnella mopanensis TaxID=2911966 RepID=UPI001EF91854|nr:TIGR01440 family protein [Cohnella mopanensis]